MLGIFIFNECLDVDFMYLDIKCKRKLMNIALDKNLINTIKVRFLFNLFKKIIITYLVLH